MDTQSYLRHARLFFFASLLCLPSLTYFTYLAPTRDMALVVLGCAAVALYLSLAVYYYRKHRRRKRARLGASTASCSDPAL